MVKVKFIFWDETSEEMEFNLTKKLNLEYNNIKEIKGLSELTNLRKLYCSMNKIKKLNLKANLNLEYLNCSYNNISELNLTSLHNLKELYCWNNNLSEAKLNLKANLKLEYVDYSFNNISELNLSNNKRLIYFKYKN
jgi:Leucine-rich repeat (LRR) protein